MINLYLIDKNVYLGQGKNAHRPRCQLYVLRLFSVLYECSEICAQIRV